MACTLLIDKAAAVTLFGDSRRGRVFRNIQLTACTMHKIHANVYSYVSICQYCYASAEKCAPSVFSEPLAR